MDLADAYRRALQALLPPGSIWRRDLNGILAELLLAAGDEMARVDARGVDLLNEADPRTTKELLPDFERVLGLPSTGTLDARRAIVTALLLRRQRYRPGDFRLVLAPILGQDADDVVILERTAADALAMGDEREIFRFFVYRDPTLPAPYDLAAAQAVVDRMKPSHTVGQVIESVGFVCDDPHSLCDRDLLAI